MEHGTYKVSESENRVSDEYDVDIRHAVLGECEVLKIYNFYNSRDQGVALFTVAHKESESLYEIRPQEFNGVGFKGVIYKRFKGDWVMFFTVFQGGDEEHNFASLTPKSVTVETPGEGWPKFL